jgi:hypothetical protein
LHHLGFEVGCGLAEGGQQCPGLADVGVRGGVTGVGVLPLAGIDEDVLQRLAQLDLEGDCGEEGVDRLAEVALGRAELRDAGLDCSVGRVPGLDVREDVPQVPLLLDRDVAAVFEKQLFLACTGDWRSGDQRQHDG